VFNGFHHVSSVFTAIVAMWFPLFSLVLCFTGNVGEISTSFAISGQLESHKAVSR